MLKRPIYKGVVKNGNAESAIIPELQIVDEATFERAQELMRARTQRHNEVPLNLAGRSLLVGNVYCGHCRNRLTLTTLSERMSSAKREEQEFEKLQSWADLYDNCTFASKKMIVSQFIKAVYVYRDYTMEVEFNVSFEEFKALSANCTNEGNERATVYPVSEEKDRLAV